MSYHLFLLPVIFLCCLRLSYVYREPLEPASIDRVLILDRLFGGVSCRSAGVVVDKSLPTWIVHNKDIKSSNTITNYFVQYYSPRSQQKKSKSKSPGYMCKLRGVAQSPAKVEEALEGHHRHVYVKERKNRTACHHQYFTPLLQS
jgi:hypothetical protein